MLLSLTISTLLAGVICQDCNWIKNLDCNSYGYNPLCGSNYVTYSNRCLFAKMHCDQPHVNVLAESSCEAAGLRSTVAVTRTMQPTQSSLYTTSEPRTVLSSKETTTQPNTNDGINHLCSQINSLDCLFEYVPDGDETICASNNITYQNFCFYSRVRCRFPHVHIANLGACHQHTAHTKPPSTSTPKTSTTVKISTSERLFTSAKLTPCSANPCQHGGSCEDLPGTFHCHCISGYIGQMCELDFDECQNNPCKNGGACINSLGSYNCACPYGFSGLLCEKGSVVCEDTPAFPCDYMLQYNMCDQSDVAMKCGHTCFQDVAGFPCTDMLKFGMCSDSSIKEKCKNTCRQCPQTTSNPSIIG